MPKLSIDSAGTKAGAPVTPIIPAYIRLPRSGQRDPYTGLSRTALFGLLKLGRVKSISLRQPGCRRGVRLIDVPSLIAAINSSGSA
jgi:hypothetical protein